MDYSTLSDEELKELLHKYTNETSAYHNEQMAIKILLNALYGQLSNKFCRWFDIRLPRSITCTGQTLIRYIARKLNELLNEECGTNNKDYVLAIDTDSVTGDTIINVDGKDIKISDYYNKCKEFIVEDEFNNKFVKKGIGKTLSVNDKLETENNNIAYVMKHKVKKRMYKLTVGGKSVVVTCNHSLMVLRDDKLIEVKPDSLKKGDKIVKIS